MAISHSTGLAAANLNSSGGIGTAFDSGILEIRSGTRPANADAAPTGTVLASFTLPADLFPATTGRSITAAAISAVTAGNSGTATWFRLRTSADGGGASTTDKRLDGDVSATAGSGDLKLDNVSIVANGQVTISSLVYTHPA